MLFEKKKEEKCYEWQLVREVSFPSPNPSGMRKAIETWLRDTPLMIEATVLKMDVDLGHKFVALYRMRSSGGILHYTISSTP